ncbi:hypothetical protein F5884DRAFT_825378 [Xylogone sp. PMI_703]|nr:hypothetical protein F5884DRAFT_825378 [Xylogone sp. PMI_703]
MAELLELKYVTLDVFTHTRYTGNPLAIVKLPPTVFLTQQQKAQIVKEFNLSETVFLHEHAMGDQNDGWDLEIFVPGAEVPFAGHPTIGAAQYLALEAQAQNKTQGIPKDINVTIITKAGSIPFVYSPREKLVSGSIPHNVHIHQSTARRSDVAQLGFNQEICDTVNEASPFVSIVKGMTFLLLELPSEEILAKVNSTNRMLHVDGQLDAKGHSIGDLVAVYFYVKTGVKDNGTVLLKTRLMYGSIEDPATGSAACALTAYLSLKSNERNRETILYNNTKAKEAKFEIHQGEYIGRPSVIGIEVIVAVDSDTVLNLVMKGSAVKIMEGTLVI